jgi:hypothetical protein
MGKSNKSLRSAVVLVGYDHNGSPIEQKTIAYDDYYGGSTLIVDSDCYRARLGIRHLIGKVFDSSGNLQQTFDNRYDNRGRYVGSRMVFADGTIIEDGKSN